ncbi:MAG: M20/M25/M40 family metallo-hydrolase, partial [Candidatus Hydrogenedentes bacterium]|nr:M20/M25/M40 family metallo-hydrolase [Candidatus Hydrogenedentota bacterium]
MKVKHRYIVGAFIAVLLASSVSAEEKVYWDVFQKIKDEVFENQEVMENASWLCDVFGPRNAKSPSYRASAEWAVKKLKEYGLSNARMEPYEFGVGYVNEYISVHMMSPQYMPLLAFPATWSSGTDGKVRGQVVYINFDEIASEAELEQYRGKLKNAIVFTAPKQEVSIIIPLLEERFSDEKLDEMSSVKVGPSDSGRRRGRGRRSRDDRLSRQQIIDFVFAEGCAAIVRTDGRSDYGSVVVENSRYTMETKPWEEDAPPNPTELIMAAEHYNRIMRILEKGVPVEMEVELRVSFTRDDLTDHNVIAEIPGTDLADEIVIIGAHLQANPAGTGAADNAAGVVASMEAMRALVAIGAKPRRTIRMGLWGTHEMGTFGNRSHVRKNFADPKTKEYKKDYDNLFAYFNMDIGTGRIRAVSVMGNEEIRSIFTEWIKPLRALGMTHIFTTGMTHEAYSEVGLPGFYFNQDRTAMDDRHAHSSMDTYERLVPEGLIQSSVVMATFAYHAAMRDE